jgi:hypothetical protein
VEIDSTTRLGRSAATWWLLALSGLITAGAVFGVVRSVLRASGIVAVSDRDALESGVGQHGFFGAEGMRVAEGISLVATVPIAVACLVVLVGLATFRPWAREGALGVLGLGGSLLLVFSLSGVLQDPSEVRALAGLALSAALLAAAGLVLSPGVRDDAEARRLQKELREREAATAARRARGLSA